MWRWKKEKQRIVKSIIGFVISAVATAVILVFYEPVIPTQEVTYEEVEITGPVFDLGDDYYSCPDDVTQEDLDTYVKYVPAEQNTEEDNAGVN